jgi:recombinational DNA repair protein (RecF pathway)
MRSYNLEGIIIKRINFGETDKIITLFTRDRGKVSLLELGGYLPVGLDLWSYSI